jgi:hypothetical protein
MVSLSLATAIATLKPLYLFVIGMVIYSIFVFKFYKFIAKRDILELNLVQYSESEWEWLQNLLKVFFYIVEYIILFPIFIAVWFTIFGLLLLLMSKNQEIGVTLLIAMAIVSAVRVTSYYSEGLSKDLAKMLPFALLGILIVDISFFSIDNVLDGIVQIPSLLETIIYYLIFAISIEFILRIYALIFSSNEEITPIEE